MKLEKILLIITVLLSLMTVACGCFSNNIEKESSLAVMTKIEEKKTDNLKPLGPDTKMVTNKAKEVTVEPLNIVAVGDILLGRGVGSRIFGQQKSFIYPFEKIVNILKEGDVVFGNLEEPITQSSSGLVGINEGGKYVLKNSVESFSGIKYAGFNLLSLANNHILDYYDKGLYDTLDILQKNNIAFAGAGKNLQDARKPAIIEKKGLKIGMISYTDMSEVLYKGDPPIRFVAQKDRYGVAPRKNNYIEEDLLKLRKDVDIIIVSLHWGVEESFEVLPEQIELSHKLIDLGADIILGHHPHQFQGIELYKGKPIVYSLGNFIFDQNDPENQEAFILKMQFLDKKLLSFSALPIRTVNKTQIVPLFGEDAKEMLNRGLELCQKLNSQCKIEADKIVFEVK